jgi:hypothetical protein
MSFSDFIRGAFENSAPKAKRAAWLFHVLVVAGTVGFGLWLVVGAVIGNFPVGGNEAALSQSPELEPMTKQEPLPRWVRICEALAPLLTPLISYGLYRWLPEPTPAGEP